MVLTVDPATALFAQLYLRMACKAGKEYFMELLKDLKFRKKEYIKDIQEQYEAFMQTIASLKPLFKNLILRVLFQARDEEKVLSLSEFQQPLSHGSIIHIL